MKTINQINREIRNLIKENPKRVKQKVSELRGYIRYLETNPSEEFVRSEYERLKKEIKVLESRFESWLEVPRHRITPNPESVYEQESGISTRKKQTKALKYLLN